MMNKKTLKEIAERRSWLLIEKNVSAAKGPPASLHAVHTPP